MALMPSTWRTGRVCTWRVPIRGTPWASPLFADLQGLPPLLIQAGGDETMLDDATLFAAAAARAGCAVTLEVFPGEPHSFQHDVGSRRPAQDAVAHMAAFALGHVAADKAQ